MPLNTVPNIKHWSRLLYLLSRQFILIAFDVMLCNLVRNF